MMIEHLLTGLKISKFIKVSYTSFNEKVILFNYIPKEIPEGMEINNGSYILFSSYENKNFQR